MKTRLAVLLLVGVLGLVQFAQAQYWNNEPAFQPGGAYASEPVFGCCAVPAWKGYGEFLLLRPSNDKVSYGVPTIGAIVPPSGVAPVQVGRESVLDIGYNTGFRGGFERALNDCSSIGAAYTHFESQVSDSVALVEPPTDRVLRSLINHPGTYDATTGFLSASGRSNIDFRLADIEYRAIWLCGSDHAVSGVVGIRYGHLEQRLFSEFRDPQTTEHVTSDINFEGGGVRLGLEAERYAVNSGFFCYGKTYASFLAGQFSSMYTQDDNFRGRVVTAGWNEDRVVPVLDLEVGLGWDSPCGVFRMTAGYTYSAWLNTLTTAKFIQAVQENNSVGVRDTLVFDGLVGRAEVRF